MGGHERAVLEGLVALRLRLVTAEQFAAAVAAWAAAPDGRLIDRLQEAGAASDATLAMVGPMADRYAEHAGGVGAAVAALGGEDADAALRSIEDAGMQATRTMLSREAPGGGGLANAPTPGDDRRYSVVRRHAAGGLGEVFVATDHELNRPVALKEIRGRHADRESSRSRFLLEAEVTGGLEHPGIVPVYGLGTHADGRPFYAMRLIRGETLKAAIADFHGGPRPRRRDFSGVAFRGLLGQFVDVCHAIAYAHARGIIHRDIKPANVMLGPHGETLVVDWGLAKALNAEELPSGVGEGEEAMHPVSGNESYRTLWGEAVGTPSYMSPEAAQGKLEEVGVASDVFSLGATLYHMATGRPPFDRSEDVLADAKERRPAPPREVMPTLPKGLEAIILKATDRDPAGRYAEATALAGDVERWLADEPVEALPETLSSRALRAVRRNPKTMAAAAAALLLAAAGTATASGLLAGKNRELGRAVAAAEAARETAEAARAEADRQRDAADANAASARQMALSLARFSDGKLGNLTGQDGVREQLMEEAYRLFKAASRDDPNAAAGQARLAGMLSQIKWFNGRTGQARALSAEAADIWRALGRREDLAAELRRRGGLLAGKDPEGAAAALSEAAGLIGELLAGSRDDPSLRRTRGLILSETAEMAAERLDDEATLAAAEQAEAEFAWLATRPAGESFDAAYALMCGAWRAYALSRLGRAEEATAAFEEARRRGEAHLKAVPDKNVRHMFAKLLLGRCDDLCEAGAVTLETAELAAEAVERYEPMAKRWAGIYSEYLDRARRTACRVDLMLGRSDGVAERLADLAESFGRRFARVPHALRRLDLARTLALQSLAADATGDRQAAGDYLRRAAEEAAEAAAGSTDRRYAAFQSEYERRLADRL